MSKKEELQAKIISLKDKFPQLENIDWSDVIRKNPDILENIVSDIVKTEGSRRKIDRRDGNRRMNAIYNTDHSERAFKDSFTILSTNESIRKTAAKIEASPAHVYNLKEGKAEPTIEIMERIAFAYNRDPSYFLEYRVHYVLQSISCFLMKNPETASAWFCKATNGIIIND